MPAEVGLVIQRLADAHPRIEGDEVWDVGEPGLHLGLAGTWIHAEHPHRSAVRPEQVEQAFDSLGLAGAVAAEEALALAGLDGEVETVQRLGAALAVGELPDFDGWGAHGERG